jgi:putative nucleotidyltransferase with HDIG domain
MNAALEQNPYRENDEKNEESKDKILFVDDEAFILFSLRRLFKQNNIDIDVETDCLKAIELVRENKYKVIVSDFKMPTMDGANFLQVVKEISPDSVRLILSAHITQDSLTEIVNKSEVYRFVNKPWRDKDLLSVIKDSIHKFDDGTRPASLTNIMLAKEIESSKSVNEEELPIESLAIEIENTVEPDMYYENILPAVDFKALDLKKSFELARAEQHQHLNYIINLTSIRIGLHCKRVSQLSAYLAKKLKLDSETQKSIYLAGLYHDVGKLFELVAQADHSEIGYNLLSSFSELKEAAKIVRYHHKRLDEDGANEIPVGSKVLAIVDYFDKEVTKERSDDVQPRSLADIIGFMEGQKGKMFSVDEMDAFKEVVLTEFKLGHFLNETKIHLTEIEEGMVLSRPLFNIDGKMLLNSEYKITKEVISRIFKHNQMTKIKSPFYVYTKTPEKEFNFNEFLASKIKV